MTHELKGKVLIVDDDPDDQHMLDTLLSREGYQTGCASNGRSSLAIAEADPPELILLDVRLPDVDGYEICRLLKSSENTRSIPVIFLSGLYHVDSKLRGFEAGGVDYITKPFQAGEVLARVETHLSLHRQRKQIEAYNVSLDATVQERTKELLEIRQLLEERLRFESMLSDVSARFVNIAPERLDAEIENALRMVLERFHVDRSALIRTLPGKTSWQVTHFAAANGQVAPVPVGAVLPRAISPWAYEMLTGNRQVVAISSLDDLPPDAHTDRQTWTGWGIRSNLTIPISVGECQDYAVAISSLESERVWPEDFIPRLRLLGEIIVNAIERRNAEQALCESEERLELATASAEVGIWIMNVGTGFVWVTEKLRELFGFAPDEELSFERFLEVIHPDDLGLVRDLVRRSLEQRELLSVEYRILHPDGSIRWILARGRLYSRGSGVPDHLMGVCGDVTQRKMLELQLSQSQTLLSALVDSTSDMIWSVDPERFGLLTFNRGLYEYFLNQRGIRIEAGMDPGDLLPTEEEAQRWRAFYRRALAEESFTVEYQVVTGARTLRLSFNRLEHDGVMFGVSVFGRDITERKRAEEALRKSEARYRSLYESMMDGYVMVDMDGTILSFNDPYQAMTGYSPDELRRLTYRNITPERWHALERRVIEEQVLIRGYSEIYEKEYRKKDGTVFPVELRTFLLKSELGGNIGMWAIVRDITSRKQIELEVQKLREELAHAGRVSMLGELTSTLAHEINQPLLAILANAEVGKRFLLQEMVDTQEIAEILDDIIRDDNRASEVVNKVRTFVKKEKPRHEPLDLNVVIQQIVDLLRGDSLLQGLSIVMDLSPDLSRVRGDSVQLQQVILNLILNGTAAMREVAPDQRKIVVRTTMLDSRTVKVSVTDFGTGVDENHIERLFEPFYTTNPQGLGVGLSISQRIIEDHGGNMEASNNQEGGATFSFTLPALQGEPP